MSKKWLVLLLFFATVSVTSLQAQSADDVLRYSLEYPAHDPVSLVMPGVSQATGFGGYQDNPASMALVDGSYLSFNLSNRFVDETATYLGNTSNFSDNQTGVGDLGFVYKFPTQRGSLVIGGGYSQTTDFNRAFSGGGRNNQSTITDFYNSSMASDSLFFAAFDVYAIDYATTAMTYDSTQSIFRFDDNDQNIGYEGINQNFEATEEGVIGEYSTFLATELLKNFTVGASIGFTSGTYSYHREFLESDRQNDYNSQFIDTEGDGPGDGDNDGQTDTDIDQINSIENIDADIQAFSARLGFIFEPIDKLSIGGSYQFPSTLHINETYNTELTTTFDNGVQFEDDAPGAFSYQIVRPQRLKAGVTARNGEGLQFSASAEGVFYSNARIEFEELELSPDEEAVNNVVESNFKDVINLRAGLEYNINNQFTPRIGYAYYPSPQNNMGSERQFISGGFSAQLTRGLIFNFGLQYSFWEDQNVLYQTPDISETVQEDVTRLHVMAGIKMVL